MASIDLTDLATVRQFLEVPDEDIDQNALIEQLIDEVSDDIESRCNRQFRLLTHTHYIDGTGRDVLLLPEGPLTSVTSVESVVYGDDGAGNRTETLTAVDQADRLEGGLLSDAYNGLGWLKMRSGVWEEGWRNYKVIYIAGFSATTADLPKRLIAAATRRVSALLNISKSTGLQSESLGSGDRSIIPMLNLDAALNRDIERFVIRRVA